LLLLTQTMVGLSAWAECRIAGVLFDVGGRPGSNVTAIDRSNRIELDDLKAWAVGDDVSTCDVSHLTELSGAFNGKADFNDPIGSWDVSNVTRTGYLFRFGNFNQDISGWDTSAMINMTGMFANAYAFNQDIRTKVMNEGTTDEYIAWDVRNNQTMEDMFWGATAFNQDIGNWDTSQLQDLEFAFARAQNFNQDISTKTVTVNGNTYTAWDVSSVTDTYGAFSETTAFNQDIGNWDVGNVTRFQEMFQRTSFNQDIGQWNTKSATNMVSMFNGNTAFNQDINTKEVTVNGNTYTAWDMSNSRLFRMATSFNQDIGDWNTQSATNMSQLFESATSFNQDIGDWNTQSATNLSQLFQGATSFNQDIGRWDTSEVTNLQNTFGGATAFDQNINTKEVTANGTTYVAWNTAKVTNMIQVFQRASSFNQDIRAWTVAPTVDLSSMFQGATGMVTKFTGVTGFDITPTYEFFNGNTEAFDDDGDGVGNGLDICPNTPTGASVDADGCADSQKDADSDGVIDGADQCPNTPTGASVDANGCAESQKDTDGDSVFDDVDNCPLVANADQLDSDGDGIGNACDLDNDNDGIIDTLEITNGTDPFNEDTDGDGIDDLSDPFPLAITQSATEGVVVRTTPSKTFSRCSLQPVAVTSVATLSPGVAKDGIGQAVVIDLAGCDADPAETLAIEIDLETTPAVGATPWAIQGDGTWVEMKNAIINGSTVSFQLTDNDPLLDRNGALGTLSHQLTLAVVIPPLPVPTRSVWAMVLLMLLLGLWGARSLSSGLR